MLNPFKVQKSYNAFIHSRITKYRIVASHPRIQVRHNETSTESEAPTTEKKAPSELPLLSACIGIDFGHTNALVGINDPTELRIIENPEGFRVTPAMVAYTEDEQVLVGVAAKRQAPGNPTATFFDLKKMLGAKFDPNFKPPFGISNREGWLLLETREETVSPVVVSGILLKYMKEIAEGHLGGRIRDAVVSIPTQFTEDQRLALYIAGDEAGLNIRSLIEDPVAIATSYGFADNQHNGKKILIFDMGGIALDVSLVQIESGEPVVKETISEWNFGGQEFDRLLTEFLAKDFEKTNKLDLLKDRFATSRLMEQAERVKVELTNSLTTEINLPYIAMLPEKGPLHINMHMTRAKFESIVDSLLKKVIPSIDSLLANAKIAKDAVDVILISGGMSRMPKIQDIIEAHMGKKITKITAPEEAVVMGAAIMGSKLAPAEEAPPIAGEGASASTVARRMTRDFVKPPEPKKTETLDREEALELLHQHQEEAGFVVRYRPESPEGWNDEEEGKWPEVEEGFKLEEFLPKKPTRMESKTWSRYQTFLGRIRGEEKIDLFEKVPVKVSICGSSGEPISIFDASTALPASKTITVSTVNDNQCNLSLQVIETKSDGNRKTLGMFNFHGISPAKAGQAEVNVTFVVDKEGLLTITARENRWFAKKVSKAGFYLAEDIARPLLEKALFQKTKVQIDSILDYFGKMPRQQRIPEIVAAEAELAEIGKSQDFAQIFGSFTAWRNYFAAENSLQKSKVARFIHDKSTLKQVWEAANKP